VIMPGEFDAPRELAITLANVEAIRRAAEQCERERSAPVQPPPAPPRLRVIEGGRTDG